MFAVSVLLAQITMTAPAASPLERQFLVLAQQWHEQVLELDRIHKAVETRFDLRPSHRGLGMRLVTEVVPGTDPVRRNTMVAFVFAGSAAQRAGVRAHDRIIAIGAEELDYETGKAVSLYLADAPDPVVLTLERDGVRRTASVSPSVIPCLQEVYDRFPVGRWQSRIAELRTLSLGEYEHLVTQTATSSSIQRSREAFSKLNGLVVLSLEAMNSQLSPMSYGSCGVRQ